jgi:predicted AAA+ superfamily ATPase
METGSLMSIRKNVKDILIPSEERHIKMYPMDFEEFLCAKNEDALWSVIQSCFENKNPLGQALHRKTMTLFREYLIVGGMPQAVSKYLETKNLRAVDSIKRKIIELYIEDFRKIDKNGKIGRLFQAIPSMLSRNVTRFHPTSIIKGLPSDKMEDLIVALEESKTVNFCYHVADPQVGLPLSEDRERFKLYVGDTGLMVTLAFWDKRFTENELYSKLLSDKLPANLGYVYENLIAQMLRAAGNKLYYHTWPKDESHSYEIDFILSRGAKICPIEVKSSNHKSHASLDAFCEKYSSRINNRYLVYTKDLRKDGETLLVPVYMAGLL